MALLEDLAGTMDESM
jgi:hypothetical protein